MSIFDDVNSFERGYAILESHRERDLADRWEADDIEEEELGPEYECNDCGHIWNDSDKPEKCTDCGSSDIEEC